MLLIAGLARRLTSPARRPPWARLATVFDATMELVRVRLKVLAVTAPGGLKLMPPPVDGLSSCGSAVPNVDAPGAYNPDTASLKAIVELMIRAEVVGEVMLMPAAFALPGAPSKGVGLVPRRRRPGWLGGIVAPQS